MQMYDSIYLCLQIDQTHSGHFQIFFFMVPLLFLFLLLSLLFLLYEAVWLKIVYQFSFILMLTLGLLHNNPNLTTQVIITAYGRKSWTNFSFYFNGVHWIYVFISLLLLYFRYLHKFSGQCCLLGKEVGKALGRLQTMSLV